MKVSNVEETRVLLKDLSSELQQSIQIQSSSCKLLNCFVNDILCLAQIKEGKFRKECSNFDIRIAIKEIMLIQKQKATVLKINFTCEFNGFD